MLQRLCTSEEYVDVLDHDGVGSPIGEEQEMHAVHVCQPSLKALPGIKVHCPCTLLNHADCSQGYEFYVHMYSLCRLGDAE